MEIKVIKPYKKFLYLILLWIVIGLLISYSDTSLENNYIHVIVVNLMLLLEVHSINEISKEETKFKQTISGLEIAHNYNLKANHSRLSAKFSKLYIKSLSFLMGILYLYIMLSLKILNLKNIIFYYGSITLIVTVYYAIRLYSKYLFYIYFIKEISAQEFNRHNYNRLFPNRTEWIISTADLMNKFKYYFSILGCIYTFEYLFTMNKNFFTLNGNNIVISTPNDYMFIISWAIIFLFIGVGYFLYSELIKYYLLKIIKQYENITLKEYESENLTQIQEKRDEYIQIYKLYATNDKIIYSDTFILERLFPYVPIALNIWKFFRVFSFS